MKRFAIDVVILPPDNITDVAIEYNKLLRASSTENIDLGKTRYLPHISLLMGCLSADQLDVVTTRLHAVAKEHKILELSISNIRTDNSAVHGVVSFEIARTEELVSLHESIVNSFRPFLTQDTEASDLADPPPIKNSTLQWINQFVPDACFENFWPHITLGFGEYGGNHLTPISFQGSRLALCHLGNHCTCAEVLAEVSLGSR
jgi:2'-5' RNA ligase